MIMLQDCALLKFYPQSDNGDTPQNTFFKTMVKSSFPHFIICEILLAVLIIIQFFIFAICNFFMTKQLKSYGIGDIIFFWFSASALMFTIQETWLSNIYAMNWNSLQVELLRKYHLITISPSFWLQQLNVLIHEPMNHLHMITLLYSTNSC